MKTLAERLTYALKIKGMKQTELAKRIGVKQPTIQYLCSKGERSGYTVHIARVLGISSHWLATGKGDMDDPDTISATNPVKERIDEIIESAQAAIDDSGKEFTDEELMEIYLDALEFGAVKGFSCKLVKTYLEEILNKKAENYKK